MFMQKLCLLVAITFSLVLTIGSSDSFAQKNKDKPKSDDDGWVVEVKPGVKRYGKVPEFGEVGQAQSFDVSPDGGSIAFCSYNKIKIWDVEDKKVVEEIKSGGSSNFFNYSSDGLSIFMVVWDQKSSAQVIKVLDAFTGDEKLSINPSEHLADDDEEDESEGSSFQVVDGGTLTTTSANNFHPQTFAVSPEDDCIAVGSGEFALVFDVKTGEKKCKIKHRGYSQALAFSSDGKQLVDGSCQLYDCETGEKGKKLPRQIFGGHSQNLQFSPKENIVASANWNSGMIVYDLDNKEKIELELPNGKGKHFYKVEFSGNGKLIAGSTYPYSTMGKAASPEVYVWDLKTKKLKNQIDLGSGNLQRIRFSANNEILYTKSHNQFGISAWDLSIKKQKGNAKGNSNPISQMKFMADDETIVALSQQGAGIVYDLETGEPKFPIHCNQSTHLDVGKNNRYAVVGANYNNVALFDTEKQKSKSLDVVSFKRPSVVSRLGGFLTRKSSGNQWENFAISDIRISEDGDSVLIASRGRQNFRFQQFGIKSGKSEHQQRFKMADYWEKEKPTEGQPISYSQLQWTPKTATISPNGELMAIINDKKDVFVVDTDSGDLLHELGGVNTSHNVNLMFVNNGSTLLATESSGIKLWDMKSGNEVSGELQLGANFKTNKIALNIAGNRMAILSNDSQLKVFDLEGFENTYSKKLGTSYIGLGVSRDGDKIALAMPNCQFEIWDLNELK